jgi:uncharacterized membrane protein YkvI
MESGSNLYDVIRVSLVLAFLAVITIFLVQHYKAVNDTATILGILTPVLGAVFGVAIGYSAGNSTGQATGADNAKQKIKADLLPKLDAVAQNRARIPGDIHPELDQAIGYVQAL